VSFVGLINAGPPSALNGSGVGRNLDDGAFLVVMSFEAFHQDLLVRPSGTRLSGSMPAPLQE
jgi:hypothetical protein